MAKSLQLKDGKSILNGHEYWCKNNRFHREDGPAIIHKDGSKFWYKEGQRHREDGPAAIWEDDEKEWWLNGYKTTREEWWEMLSDDLKIKLLFDGNTF